MKVLEATPGLRGIDIDQVMSFQDARMVRRAGYSFVARYVRRTTRRSSDITFGEAMNLATAGLGWMLVQHVESSVSWDPSTAKAESYAQGAVTAAAECEYPKGATLWLDLEGVKPGTPPQVTIDYCNRWHDLVSAGGWVPGIYVGWRAGLDRDQLYHRLRFQRYWAAYNLNSDQEPAVRGVCMRQRRQQTIAGTTLEFDPDLVYRDALGGLPTFAAPDEWEAAR